MKIFNKSFWHQAFHEFERARTQSALAKVDGMLKNNSNLKSLYDKQMEKNDV